MTLEGTFKASGDSQGVSLALTRRGETFSATDCVARFDASVGEGIAPGRIWADVRCADSANPTAQQTCSAHAQIRFENCAQ